MILIFAKEVQVRSGTGTTLQITSDQSFMIFALFFGPFD